jgi:hypothetical protein
MINNVNRIDAGNQSINNQATSITNHIGLSYSDVKEIALDLFKSNFLKLKDEAAALASERATEITNKFLKRMKDFAPDSLNEFATPGMQDTFFQAQKEYAISGDVDLADMLVEMLVERAGSPNRNNHRMVLDESLKIAPKLTIQQMDLLTITQYHSKMLLSNLGSFDNLLIKLNYYFQLMDFVDIETVNEDLAFLEYLGLGKQANHPNPKVEKVLMERYPSYFSKGFDYYEYHIPEIPDKELYIKCFHDPKRLQFKFETEKEIDDFFKARNISTRRSFDVRSLFTLRVLLEHQISEILIQRIDNFKPLVEMYNLTNWKSFEISNIGKAIAVANLHRRYGKESRLDTFI